jgi:thiamine-phosphate diphosphorylase
VELGLQTSKEETAKLIRRGYPNAVFEKAVSDLRARGLEVIVHLILGLPGEDHGDEIASLRYAASFPIQGVKLHLLHVLRGTDLAEMPYEALTMEEFLFRVEEALKGGATMVQLREKEKTVREYIQLAEKVHRITKKYNVPLIIDDRVDVALAIDAEGVHVGQDDMPVCMARKLMGKDKIVGATTKTVIQAKEAREQGADYLGVGAIYPTTTKVRTVITSTDTLKDICGSVSIPVNAIGGLNKDNIDVLKGIPIAGICVVSAIMKAESPRKASAELIERAKELELW